MKSWIILENVPSKDFRELELVFPHPTQEGVLKKFIRLFPDGHLEVGEKNSPFVPEYSVSVVKK